METYIINGKKYACSKSLVSKGMNVFVVEDNGVMGFIGCTQSELEQFVEAYNGGYDDGE